MMNIKSVKMLNLLLSSSLILSTLILIFIFYNSVANSNQALAQVLTANNYLGKELTMLSSVTNSTRSSIEQLVQRQANAWENADSEKIIADFAEESIFIAPGLVLQGRRQIKQAAEDYFAKFVETKVQIKRIIFQDNQGVVEWDWREKKKETDEVSQAEDAIVFELEKGKIKYWREYIDKGS